uniref:CDK5 regulatory subunit-associated protein 3 n=1 Tax=Syphacia muris TaxID=451379 RepID=A0A0N5AVS9_9BILA
MADTQQLPIDIHSNKLLGWLINHRHCKNDWQSSALVVREKIKHAILDMPEDERIVKVLQGTYINYFHCLKILDILKETEKDTKNFLGFYSSQRMNDWLEIKKLYEKDNLYLAEAAQFLQRLVQYDIPSLRKQITKSDLIATECVKKAEEYTKQAENSKKQYERELVKLGLEGKNLRREIQMLAIDLPNFFNSVASNISELTEPLEYYGNFRNYLHRAELPKSELLPLCTLLMQNGPNVTVYQWKYGKEPLSVERPKGFAGDLEDDVANEAKDVEENDEIDFGDMDVDAENAEAGIDGIEVVSDTEENKDDGIARGDDALTLLENEKTRDIIINELNELYTFLFFRFNDEVTENSANIYISGFENRPENVANVTASAIDEWRVQVKEIYDQLTDDSRNQLFKIYSEPAYVSTLVEELEQKRSLEDRYLKMSELMVQKKAKCTEVATKSQVELIQIIESTKILQHEANDISKRYKGTPVNLMGGIVATLKDT